MATFGFRTAGAIASAALIASSLPGEVAARQNTLSYDNNFYVILSTSKFFFNYRHSSNVMIFYQYLKRHGIPDDRVGVQPFLKND